MNVDKPFRVFRKSALVSKHKTREQAIDIAKKLAKAFGTPYKVTQMKGTTRVLLETINP